MEKSTPILYDRFQFKGIRQFLNLLGIRKCRYYASDFLEAKSNRDLIKIEDSVQRTIQVFNTLELPSDQHFYIVYRSGPDFIYKDWKLSELACVYMMVNGDPTDLRSLAHQQTELIDQMLQQIHPLQMIVDQPVHHTKGKRY